MPKSSEPGLSGPGKYASLARGVSGARGSDTILEMDSAVLANAIAAILSAGDAIQFSVTRDGGAVVTTVYSEPGVDKVYTATATELLEVCVALREAAQSG